MERNISVLYDDRDERAGVKFKDADLYGAPVEIVIGERNLKEGYVEVRVRDKGLVEKVPVENLKTFVIEACKNT
jgi:prolyl-tRNA synthetase